MEYNLFKQIISIFMIALLYLSFCYSSDCWPCSSDSYEAEKLSDVCSKLELLINIYYWHGTINSALITLHYFTAIAEIIAFFYFIELKSLLLNGKYHHSSKFSICLLFYIDYLWNAQFCDFHSIISKFNSSHLKYS